MRVKKVLYLSFCGRVITNPYTLGCLGRRKIERLNGNVCISKNTCLIESLMNVAYTVISFLQMNFIYKNLCKSCYILCGLIKHSAIFGFMWIFNLKDRDRN